MDNPPASIESTWLEINGFNAHRYIYYPDNKWGTPGVYTTIQLRDGNFIEMTGAILHKFNNYIDQIIEVENSFQSL